MSDVANQRLSGTIGPLSPWVKVVVRGILPPGPYLRVHVGWVMVCRGCSVYCVDTYLWKQCSQPLSAQLRYICPLEHRSASPGRVGAFEDVLARGDDAGEAALVMAVTVAALDGARTVGVAVLDASARTIAAAQFADDDRFCTLEAVVTQLAPKECVIVKVGMHLAYARPLGRALLLPFPSFSRDGRHIWRRYKGLLLVCGQQTCISQTISNTSFIPHSFFHLSIYMLLSL